MKHWQMIHQFYVIRPCSMTHEKKLMRPPAVGFYIMIRSKDVVCYNQKLYRNALLSYFRFVVGVLGFGDTIFDIFIEANGWTFDICLFLFFFHGMYG